ncbi:hypothetical protein [Caldinitratiruptor microaerophilus]|nr:hypothetical protein [Caldinitratiruptor microaerophilus]
MTTPRSGPLRSDTTPPLLRAYHLLLGHVTQQGRPMTDEEREALRAILDAHAKLERDALKRRERELRRKAKRRAAGGGWA